jgi:hypothetical protein
MRAQWVGMVGIAAGRDGGTAQGTKEMKVPLWTREVDIVW